jgi:hypothetical protein
MTKIGAILALAALFAAGSTPAIAQIQDQTQPQTQQSPAQVPPGDKNAGFLTCHAASGWGFIFGSSRSVKCVFSGGNGYTAYYKGDITKFGGDIGYLKSAVIVWAVLAPATTIPQQVSLAGHYAGVSGSAAFGVGAGANILVGGSENHFMLQPLSIEGQTGLNVAAGIAMLSMHPADAG